MESLLRRVHPPSWDVPELTPDSDIVLLFAEADEKMSYDHFHHFTADGPDRGFLTMTVQVHIGGLKMWIQPLARPGEANLRLPR